jgi:UDP-sulfoquinovose synthase
MGGDGYLGWPTAMYLSARDHDVAVLDNFSKRAWERELNAAPLIPVSTLADRVRTWQEVTGRRMASFVGDLCEYDFIRDVLRDFHPDAMVHYGEQPSAPYSMIDQRRCVMTQVNNITGTLNILWAMREHAPAAHLVKLGTMGEYGTPNIDIEEGFIEIEHKGRKDILPYPKQAGSFYHLSKVHDSHNITFTCKVWKLRSTDLHQGVVYGLATDESELHPDLATSFHYDEVFGTALNRFCVQAIAGIPLTVYGKGGQTRGFLNIRDTLRCVELSILNPPQAGEYRAFNQFTQMCNVLDLAKTVQQEAQKLGFQVEINHLANPRVEAEQHYYNPRHEKLLNLGLQPRLLSDVLVDSMLGTIRDHAHRIRHDVIMPRIKWASPFEPAVKTCDPVS